MFDSYKPPRHMVIFVSILLMHKTELCKSGTYTEKYIMPFGRVEIFVHRSWTWKSSFCKHYSIPFHHAFPSFFLVWSHNNSLACHLAGYPFYQWQQMDTVGCKNHLEKGIYKMLITKGILKWTFPEVFCSKEEHLLIAKKKKKSLSWQNFIITRGLVKKII